MSSPHDPFDPELSLARCSCGRHSSPAEHDLEMAARERYQLQLRLVEIEYRTPRIVPARPPLPEMTVQPEYPGRHRHTLH